MTSSAGTLNSLSTENQNLLAAIASELERRSDAFLGFGYARGILGAALFNFYYGRLTQDQTYTAKAGRQIEQAFSMVNDFSWPYFSQLSELGIFLQFIHEHGFSQEYPPDECLADVDGVVVRQMAKYLENGDVGGYTNGGLVLGRYLLSRLKTTRTVTDSLCQYVDECDRWAVTSPQGIYWRSKLFRDDRTYLSMPHGSAAMVLFLTRLWEEGLQSEQVRRLITDSISFILSRRRNPEPYHSYFSDILHLPNKPSRLSLCYGDLGIGYALLRAGQALSLAQAQEAGLQILRYAAQRRTPEQTMLGDAGILYGASGLALAFDNVYRLTHDASLAEARNHWFHQIPDWRTSHPEFLGFRSQYNHEIINTGVSVYEGIAGIGLTLMRLGSQTDLPHFDELIWLL